MAADRLEQLCPKIVFVPGFVWFVWITVIEGEVGELAIGNIILCKFVVVSTTLVNGFRGFSSNSDEDEQNLTTHSGHEIRKIMGRDR